MWQLTFPEEPIVKTDVQFSVASNEREFDSPNTEDVNAAKRDADDTNIYRSVGNVFVPVSGQELGGHYLDRYPYAVEF